MGAFTPVGGGLAPATLAGLGPQFGYQQVVTHYAPPEPAKPVAAPKVTDLARAAVVAVEPSESVAAERRTLAQKAAKVLGYKVLGEKISAEETKKRAKWEARRVFEKLGFDPLDSERVAAYQDQMRRHLNGMQYWEITPLEKYTQPVPEFALSRAIELKGELPTATFHVEHLQYKPDPFLVMMYGGEKFYIDVWDEPIFEGRRSV